MGTGRPDSRARAGPRQQDSTLSVAGWAAWETATAGESDVQEGSVGGTVSEPEEEQSADELEALRVGMRAVAETAPGPGRTHILRPSQSAVGTVARSTRSIAPSYFCAVVFSRSNTTT